MTFRLPFQIFRAVTLPRPTSPDRLIKSTYLGNTFQRNISSAVATNRNLPCSTTCKTKQNPSLLPRYVPSYSFQRRFRSNIDNRKKVRKQHKCHERKCERELVFRNTSREDCKRCLPPIEVPNKCPKLRRLKPHYDQSKLKYDHGKCPTKCKPPRMDEVKGLKVVKKKLPKLPVGDCEKCIVTPTKAPKLAPPEKLYEPSELEQVREDCKPCDICAPRMDDVLGLKVTPKTLPKLPVSDCEICQVVPTKAPKLVPPKALYDPSELEQNRVCIEPKDEKPLRMDTVVGLRVESKELPTIPFGDCEKCLDKPTYSPKLVRLKSKYDASQLKWQFPDCKTCDICAPRMDDIVGYKVVKKCLPKLVEKCERCLPKIPTILPKLLRPGKIYDDTQMKWKHTKCKDPKDCKPPRMDEVVGYKVKRKNLPALKPHDKCTYCQNIPTVAPRMKRLRKKFDDSEMKWEHEDCPVVCKPPRSDDVRGYKVVPKTLKMIPVGDCKVCINKPTKAPKLKRLKLKYNPNELKYVHQDCNPCDVCAPRMDDVVGLKVKKKTLPKLPVGDCEKCIVTPKYAPKLKRLDKLYDPSEMKWKHEHCDPCPCPPRMDDVMGYKVKPKKLPKLESEDCVKCINPPTYAPKLKRLKQRYDPYKLEKPRKCKPDLCDLDPPRMDDVKCWKPKKKILPSFNSNTQTRHYSTFAIRRKYTPKHLQLLRKKAIIYSRRYKSKKKPFCPPEPEQCVAPKQDNKCLKACPKFRMKDCKVPEDTVCREYKEKTCTKRCAPYDAYTDCMGDMYEDEMSECINWNQVLLQPKKQVSGTFCKIRPPPPKWDHIDPSLERKCVASPKPCPMPRTPKPEWCNPCVEFKMKHCKPRGRKHCNDFTKKPRCKKLEAPYLSFTDYCPQFPEKELDECEIAENMKHDYMVNYFGQCMDFKREKGNFGPFRNLCEPRKTDCETSKKAPFPKCRQKDKDKSICAPVRFPFKRAKCKSKVGEDNDDCRKFKNIASKNKSSEDVKTIGQLSVGAVASSNLEFEEIHNEKPPDISSNEFPPETLLSEIDLKNSSKHKMELDINYLSPVVTSEYKSIDSSSRNGILRTQNSSHLSASSAPFSTKINRNNLPSLRVTSLSKNKCKKCKNEHLCVCPTVDESGNNEMEESFEMECNLVKVQLQCVSEKASTNESISPSPQMYKCEQIDGGDSANDGYGSQSDTQSLWELDSRENGDSNDASQYKPRKKKKSSHSKNESKTCSRKPLYELKSTQSKECKISSFCGASDKRPVKYKCRRKKPKEPVIPFRMEDCKVCKPVKRCEKPIKKKPPPESTVKTYAKLVWKTIHNYFGARPDCPPPRVWKQRYLEEKAIKAATEAGLIISRPEFNYVKVDRKKCAGKSIEKKSSQQTCQKPNKSKCKKTRKPKKSTACSTPNEGSTNCSRTSESGLKRKRRKKLKTKDEKPGDMICTPVKFKCKPLRRNRTAETTRAHRKNQDYVSCSEDEISITKPTIPNTKKPIMTVKLIPPAGTCFENEKASSELEIFIKKPEKKKFSAKVASLTSPKKINKCSTAKISTKRQRRYPRSTFKKRLIQQRKNYPRDKSYSTLQQSNSSDICRKERSYDNKILDKSKTNSNKSIPGEFPTKYKFASPICKPESGTSFSKKESIDGARKTSSSNIVKKERSFDKKVLNKSETSSDESKPSKFQRKYKFPSPVCEPKSGTSLSKKESVDMTLQKTNLSDIVEEGKSFDKKVLNKSETSSDESMPGKFERKYKFPSPVCESKFRTSLSKKESVHMTLRKTNSSNIVKEAKSFDKKVLNKSETSSDESIPSRIQRKYKFPSPVCEPKSGTSLSKKKSVDMTLQRTNSSNNVEEEKNFDNKVLNRSQKSSDESLPSKFSRKYKLASPVCKPKSEATFSKKESINMASKKMNSSNIVKEEKSFDKKVLNKSETSSNESIPGKCQRKYKFPSPVCEPKSGTGLSKNELVNMTVQRTNSSNIVEEKNSFDKKVLNKSQTSSDESLPSKFSRKYKLALPVCKPKSGATFSKKESVNMAYKKMNSSNIVEEEKNFDKKVLNESETSSNESIPGKCQSKYKFPSPVCEPKSGTGLSKKELVDMTLQETKASDIVREEKSFDKKVLNKSKTSSDESIAGKFQGKYKFASPVCKPKSGTNLSRKASVDMTLQKTNSTKIVKKVMSLEKKVLNKSKTSSDKSVPGKFQRKYKFAPPVCKPRYEKICSKKKSINMTLQKSDSSNFVQEERNKFESSRNKSIPGKFRNKYKFASPVCEPKSGKGFGKKKSVYMRLRKSYSSNFANEETSSDKKILDKSETMIDKSKLGKFVKKFKFAPPVCESKSGTSFPKKKSIDKKKSSLSYKKNSGQIQKLCKEFNSENAKRKRRKLQNKKLDSGKLDMKNSSSTFGKKIRQGYNITPPNCKTRNKDHRIESKNRYFSSFFTSFEKSSKTDKDEEILKEQSETKNYLQKLFEKWNLKKCNNNEIINEVKFDKKYKNNNPFSVRPCSKVIRRFKNRSVFSRNRYFQPFSSDKKRFCTCSKNTEKNEGKINKQNRIDKNINLQNLPNISKSDTESQSNPYLKLNDNYIGKMYNLKLSKFEAQKVYDSQNFDDEPFTICQLCKVIPKSEFFKYNRFRSKKCNGKSNREKCKKF